MPNTPLDDEIKQYLKGLSVPPQPQILVDVNIEQAMPGADIAHIATLIAQDTGLSGCILKIANGLIRPETGPTASIKDAVSLLGLTGLTTVVDGFAIKGRLEDDVIVELSRYWDTATEVAVACEAIAREIGFEYPDEAYTLGLLHNCGATLLFLNSKTEYNDIVKTSYSADNPDKRIIDVENNTLKTNHAVIGYYIAKSWKLPLYLCEIIADHHSCISIFTKQKEEDYEPKKRTLLGILKMAEHMIGLYKILGGQEEDHEWQIIKDPVMDQLHICLDTYDKIIEDLHERWIGLLEPNQYK